VPVDAPLALEVRPATEEDLSGVLACLAGAFEPFRGRYTPEAFLHTVLDARLGHERLVAMRVWVAVEPSGTVVGTLAWGRTSTESGHLRGMAVLPKFQGSGVAQRLLDGVLSEMTGAGCRYATLRTTQPLDRAVRFYERNGFRPNGVTADFHGMVVTERRRPLASVRP